MKRFSQAAAFVGALSLSMPVFAQDPAPEAQAAAEQATGQVSEGPAPDQCAAPTPAANEARAQAGDGKKGDLGKDVGSAVGGTAGQIAGAAVGGPIGAAAGGVAVERAGRAVAGVLKGDKKKKRQREEAQRRAAAACSPEPAAQP